MVGTWSWALCLVPRIDNGVTAVVSGVETAVCGRFVLGRPSGVDLLPLAEELSAGRYCFSAVDRGLVGEN